MSSDEEDERETVEHQTSPVIDEAEVHDGLRAFFPLSFGKQEAKPVSLESIHSKTKRDNEAKPAPLRERFQKSLKKKGLQEKSDTHIEDYHGFVGAFPPNSRVIGPSLPSKDAELRKDIVIGPRRPSKDAELREDVVIGPRRPSKDADLREDMVIGPPRPSKDAELREDMVIGPRRLSADENSIEDMMTAPPRPSGEENSREDMMIGPPRPSADESSREDMMIGPPQPSPDENSREEIMIGPPRPSADENLREDMLIGPPMPQYRSESSKSSDQSEEEEEEDNDGDEGAYLFPVSNEIILKGHTKVVSTLAVDQTGSRVLTGSYDYSVRMYDFQGMDARLRSFRQLEPFEGHQVRSLSWSPTADRFVCVTGAAQAKIYDRDGVTLGEFLKGDMYIRDLKNTKGHISGLTCGEWNPKDKQLILTSSEDGSLRVWDVNDFKSQKQVIKPRLARPGRVAVTACTWGLDGKCLAGGLVNGSVQIWNVKAGWGSRPDIYIEKAHEDSEEVTGLHFSADGHTLLSRSTDNTLKVWDLRHTTSPLKVFSDLFNSYAQTNVAFSPDEQFILTGTSIDKDGKSGGSLYFFHKQRLELVRRIGISATESVVCCTWHPRLNQIFTTTGDKKGGGTHILYDPGLSERGALICVARAPRQKSVDDFEARPVIHHPHALPLFRDEPSRKRQREKARTDPLKSRRPDLPVTGPGFGGRVGSTKGSLLTQYLLKEGGLIKETWMEEDPREAILKYADAAAKDPKFIAPAYARTQPETIFAESDSEEEDK